MENFVSVREYGDSSPINLTSHTDSHTHTHTGPNLTHNTTHNAAHNNTRSYTQQGLKMIGIHIIIIYLIIDQKLS